MSILGRLGGSLGFGKSGGAGGSMTATSTGTTATPSTGLKPGNGYVYHTFTGPGTLSVSAQGEAEVMVIGGGGGAAGHAASGGGGAGGVAYNPRLSMTAGSYTITVGAGGAVGPNHSTSYQGENSSLGGGGYTITGLGGGRSGRYTSGDAGGSGGGAAGYPVPNVNAGAGNQSWQSQPSGTLNFGNVGGVRYSGGNHAGSGGGGAGSAGENSPGPSQGGRGGEGLQFPQFTGPQIGLPALAPLSGYFAAGGGAGGWNGETGGTGGTGGGGSGFTYGTNGTPGVANTGSGGGGGNGPSNSGGGGGSGIVVIRYPEVQWPTPGNGLSVSSPGSSAYQIKKDNPNFGDGFYYIQGKTGVILVYCDMTYDGGGWMHIHRCNGTGTTGASQTSVRAAVGSISGASVGTTTGSIPSTYKIADADINYWMQNSIVGTDRPSGHNLPCFRAHHNDLGPTGGAVDYFTVTTTSVLGARTAFGNASIDFRGGPNYPGGGYGGSMSVAGWDTYASFTSSPNTPVNNSGYQNSVYSWGTQLFYNHNTWGNQTIYNSTSNGFYTGGGWTLTGGLWYR